MGHEIKSRASINTITNDRIYTDGIVTNGTVDTSGTDSMQLDLPNGGVDTVTGDIFEKGIKSENPHFIGYGEAPSLIGTPLWSPSSLKVEKDMFINDSNYGSKTEAIWNDSGLSSLVTATADELWNIPMATAFAGVTPVPGANTELALRPMLDYSHPWNDVAYVGT